MTVVNTTNIIRLFFLISCLLFSCMRSNNMNTKFDSSFGKQILEFESGEISLEEIKECSFCAPIEKDFMDCLFDIILANDVDIALKSYQRFHKAHNQDSSSSYFLLLEYVHSAYNIPLDFNVEMDKLKKARKAKDYSENVYVEIFEYLSKARNSSPCDTAFVRKYLKDGEPKFSDYSLYNLLCCKILAAYQLYGDLVFYTDKIKYKQMEGVLLYYQSLYYGQYLNNISKAIELLEKARKINGNSKNRYWLDLFTYYMASEQRAMAEQMILGYDGIVSYDFYVAKGLFAETLELYDSALTMYKRASSINELPFQFEDYFLLSKALYRFDNLIPLMDDERFADQDWYWLCKIEYFIRVEKDVRRACSIFKTLNRCSQLKILQEMRAVRPDNPEFKLCD